MYSEIDIPVGSFEVSVARCSQNDAFNVHGRGAHPISLRALAHASLVRMILQHSTMYYCLWMLVDAMVEGYLMENTALEDRCHQSVAQIDPVDASSTVMERDLRVTEDLA